MTAKEFAEMIASKLESRTAEYYLRVESYKRDPNGHGIAPSDAVLLADECKRLAALVRDEVAKLED